jgi:hypothetical protein
VDAVKELLDEERHRVKLYETVAGEVRRVLDSTAVDSFPLQQPWSQDAFRDRVGQYGGLLGDLVRVQALLGFWGTSAHARALTLAPKRLSGRLGAEAGNTGWLALRWYPALLVLYAGGIAAVAAERYDNLRELMLCGVPGAGGTGTLERPFVRVVTGGFDDVAKAFNLLPDHDRQHVPKSEYLYKLLRPLLDDLLFLDSDYEAAFDRFESLYALEHAHQYEAEGRRCWGPIGRFGWKMLRGHDSPLAALASEAERQGATWPPVAAGLFAGSIERFKDVAKAMGELTSRLGWG